jgi:hypothetical protein
VGWRRYSSSSRSRQWNHCRRPQRAERIASWQNEMREQTMAVDREAHGG